MSETAHNLEAEFVVIELAYNDGSILDLGQELAYITAIYCLNSFVAGLLLFFFKLLSVWLFVFAVAVETEWGTASYFGSQCFVDRTAICLVLHAVNLGQAHQ